MSVPPSFVYTGTDMKRVATCLVIISLCLVGSAGAELGPAAGTLLVATEDVQGEIFAKTVILLVSYDESGAMGLVVNRPTEVLPKEVLPELASLTDYDGTLYWGGPVEMASLRALLHSDRPPKDAIKVIDGVYRAPLAEELPRGISSSEQLRFYIGYAGWAPGQLEHEIALGSWDIVPASAEIIFAKDAADLWQHLSSPRQYRAAL